MSLDKPEALELIQRLSHEVRNNSAALTSLLELVDVLLPEDAESEVRSSLTDSLTSLGDLTRLHQQVEWIAKWASGHPVAVPQPGDVKEALQEVALRTQRMSVTIEPPREPLKTTGAGNALVHVIELLVANGVRHGGAPVQVSARAVGKSIVVDIGDSGPAVARSLHERAFQMRQQSEMRRESGSRYQPGAGLAIAKLVVEALGGQLETRGSDGAWLVRILLPRA